MTVQHEPPLGPVGQLLSDPKRWTKKAFAKDADGELVPEESPLAVCWCLSGALDKVYKRLTPEREKAAVAIQGYLELIGYHKNILWFNDNPFTTHEDLMNLLRKTGV